jgi:uncharacterized protein YjbI with pentapeptide repeats
MRRAGKLKGDSVEGLELKGSDAEGVGLEGAQLGSLRVVKLPRRSKVAMGRSGAQELTACELEGSNPDGLDFEGVLLESLRVAIRMAWSSKAHSLGA